MIAEIAAVEAALAPLNVPVYFADVDDQHPLMPYVLIWGSPGIMSAPALCGTRSDITGRLGVTSVDTTPRNALLLAGRVREILQPDGLTFEAAVGNRYLTLTFFDSQDVTVDRQVTIPGTGRHPAYAVDLYSLNSTPA